MVKEQVNTQYLSFLSTLCVLILFSRENHASFLYAQVVLVKQCTVAWRCTVGVVLDRRVPARARLGSDRLFFTPSLSAQCAVQAGPGQAGCNWVIFAVSSQLR